MSEDIRVVELDKYQRRAVILVLNEKRDELIKKHEYIDVITEVLQKVINAPPKEIKKSLFKRKKQLDAR